MGMLNQRGQSAAGELPFSALLAAVFLFFYLPTVYYFGWLVADAQLIDFPSYYYGAYLTFIYRKIPYGLDAFDFFSKALNHKVNPYLYPPPSLLLFWPLGYLSRTGAQAVFLVVSHLSYLGSVWLMLFRLLPVSVHPRAREITLAVCVVFLAYYHAVFATFAIGQVNLMILLFICLALAGIREDWSPLWIAFPLALAIIIKVYPVLLLVPLLFRKQFRTVGLTALFVAIPSALSFWLLPAGTWQTWLSKIVPLAYGSSAIAGGFPFNQSLNGFVMRLFVESVFSSPLFPYPLMAKPVVLCLVTVLLGVTILGCFQFSRAHADKKASDDELAAFLVLSFLIAPISWDHHLVYILPAAVLVIARMIDGNVRRWPAVFLIVALYFLAWQFPMENPAFRAGWLTLVISVKLYAVVAIWIYFIYRLYAQGFRIVDKQAVEIPHVNLIQ